jgi:hypothetical protein
MNMLRLLTCVTLLSLLPASLHALEPATQPATGPATAPATAPTTVPATRVHADAAPLLDAMCEAYARLRTLRQAGQLLGTITVDGVERPNEMKFESLFVRDGAFRHTSGDIVVSGSETRLYLYHPVRNVYVRHPRPKELAFETMPTSIRRIVVMQNPSLATALAGDARAVVLEGVSEVRKMDDTNVDGVAMPTLLLVAQAGGGDTMVVIDPKTSLIRQVVFDLTPYARSRAATQETSASLTVDYLQTEIDIEFAPEQLAWTVPDGARQVHEPQGHRMPIMQDNDGADEPQP